MSRGVDVVVGVEGEADDPGDGAAAVDGRAPFVKMGVNVSGVVTNDQEMTGPVEVLPSPLGPGRMHVGPLEDDLTLGLRVGH
jgi:hypothetical protein